MTQERSPERRRPPAGREGVDKKVLRVSHRKELAVVTLGMVAAISGVGGFLAENPSSWATGVESATTTQQTAQQQTRGQATEQGTVRRALQSANGQRETARGAAARVVPARKESGQAARRQRKDARRAEAKRTDKRAARQQQQAVFSAQPKASASTASASAVSRGS